MNLQCVSFDLKKSSLEAKKALVIKEEEFVFIFNKIKQTLGLSELLILSTCNRTEVYFFSEKDQTEELFHLFKLINNVSLSKTDHFDFLLIPDNKKALKHLSEVALGMHSQVLGDIQVIHQVKTAYKKSCELGGAQLYLHKVMHRIFALNKRVSNETEFKKGVSSISSAAMQFVKKISKSKKVPVLIVGTGESGEETIKNLLNSGYRNLTVVNRTYSKAVDVANKFGIKCQKIHSLNTLVEHHKIIISSLSTSEKVINRTNVPMSLSTYQYRFFLDLSVLGVVDESIEENPENLVFGLKYMKDQNEETVQLRQKELPKVNAFISSEIESLEAWFMETKLINKLAVLKEQVTKINQIEILSLLKNELSEIENKLSPLYYEKIAQRFLEMCERQNLLAVLKEDLYSVFSVAPESVNSKA